MRHVYNFCRFIAIYCFNTFDLIHHLFKKSKQIFKLYVFKLISQFAVEQGIGSSGFDFIYFFTHFSLAFDDIAVK